MVMFNISKLIIPRPSAPKYRAAKITINKLSIPERNLLAKVDMIFLNIDEFYVSSC